MDLSFTPWSLAAFRRQHVLLEFASLKHVKLRGLYATITPGNSSLWRCVLFVRKGPYDGALLRFGIRFPDNYPFELPFITFERGLFHPLVVGEEARRGDDVFVENPEDASLQKGEATGQFNLRSGFKDNAKDVNKPRLNIVDLLLYVRSCFDSTQILDSLQMHDIVNLAAWQAWQNHNEHLRNYDEEANENDIWQQEMMKLLERSSNTKAEDLFEQIVPSKFKADSLQDQHDNTSQIVT